MRQIITLLLATALTAWMAYLSWPVSADAPVGEKASVSAPSATPLPDVYEAYEPRSTQSAV